MQRELYRAELFSFSPVISCVLGDKLPVLYYFRAKKLYLHEMLLQETEVRATLKQLSYLKYAIEYAYLVVHANNRFCSALVTVEVLSEF